MLYKLRGLGGTSCLRLQDRRVSRGATYTATVVGRCNSVHLKLLPIFVTACFRGTWCSTLNLEAVSSSDTFVLYGLASKKAVILHSLQPNSAADPRARDLAFQQLVYQHLVGALGEGIGPSLGVYLRRTTQKTYIPRLRIRTAEMYVRALEERRLGHRDQLKTSIAVFHILWTVRHDILA
jgi:hypothetical protein